MGDWVLIYVCAFPRGVKRGVFNAYCFIQTEVLIVLASILPLSHSHTLDSSRCLNKMSLFLCQQELADVAFGLRCVRSSNGKFKW